MERNQMVMNRVREHYDYLVAHGYNVAFVALQGSQNYELDIYSDEYMSDVDTKAVVIPTLKDIVSGRAPLSTVIVLENNEHIDVKDIRVMTEMFKKQNISYLELLFTKFKVFNPMYEEVSERLFASAEVIATYNHITFYKGIKGMALEKQKALCHPYPNTMDKIDKFGYDPKQLHHICRLYTMAEELQTGTPLRKCFVPFNKPFLINVKLGMFDLDNAVKLAAETVRDISEICDRLASAEKPIKNEVKEFLDQLTSDFIEVSIRKELSEK